MILKLKTFALRHKLLPLIIGFIYLYLFTIVSKGQLFAVDEITYHYHTVDFTMGFCTKILQGEIYRRLVGVYTEKAMNLYLNVLFFVFICLLSVLLERFLNAMPRQYVKSSLFLLFLFITGPFTLAAFVDEFGLLDFYWILFTVVSLFFLTHKILRWLIPVILFLTILIHYSSVLCYVAGVILLILFMAVRESDRKEKKQLFGLFTVSSLSSVAEVLYFVRFERENLRYPMEIFHKILLSRGTDYFRYYDFAFYKSEELPLHMENVLTYSDIPDFIPDGTIKDIYYQIAVSLRLNTFEYYWFYYILAAFLFLLLVYVLIYAIRHTDHKGKKITEILMIALFFCIPLFSVFFSTDTMRWISHAFIILFGYVFYLLFYECRDVLEKLERFLKSYYYPVAVFCLIYCFTTVHIYSIGT